jgi:branched-subunit amino acid transport protein
MSNEIKTFWQGARAEFPLLVGMFPFGMIYGALALKAGLSAIVFPDVFLPNQQLDLSLGNHRLLAGVMAVAVAYFTKNTLITILAGMIALVLLQIFF